MSRIHCLLATATSRRWIRAKTLDVYRWALDKLISEFQDLPLLPRELAPVLDDPSLAQESRRQLLKVLRFFYRWCGREYGRTQPGGTAGADS